jgi:hypothetical protein
VFKTTVLAADFAAIAVVPGFSVVLQPQAAITGDGYTSVQSGYDSRRMVLNSLSSLHFGKLLPGW